MSNIASAQHTITEVDDGIRGTGIYNITTAPTQKTQTVGGVSSSYYISLTTAKQESGQNQILIGDQLSNSYYLYPVVHVDGTNVYCSARTSIQGNPGASGKGVQSTAIAYAKSANGTDASTIAANNWKETIAAVGTIPEGQYLWTRTIITYTDGQKTTSYSVSKQAVTGYSIVGSITQSSLEEKYWTTLGTVDSTHTWSNSATLGQQCRVGDIITIVGTATDTKNGHTIYAKITGFDASGNIITKCLSHMIAERGQAGISPTIASTEIKYAVNQNGTSYPTDPSAWKALSEIKPNPGDYVWTRTIVNYSPSGSTTSYSVARQGTNGNSVTIKEQWVKYKVDTQGKTPPSSGWQDSFPTSIAEGQYLWTETYVKYSDDSEQKTHSVSLQGKSVTVTKTTIRYTTSASGTIIPDKTTGGWQSTVPTTNGDKKYLWTWTEVTFSGGTTADTFSVSSNIDSVVVGYRNYIVNSDRVWTNTLGDGNKWSVIKPDGDNGLYLSEVLPYVGTGENICLDFSLEIKVDDTLAFDDSLAKCWAEVSYKSGTNTVHTKVGYTNATAMQQLNSNAFPRGQWVRIHKLLTASITEWIAAAWKFEGVLGSMSIRRPQLVIANMETDWSIAPEDTIDRIQSVEDSYNKFLAEDFKDLTTTVQGKAESTTLEGVKKLVNAQGNEIKTLDHYRAKQELDSTKWQLQLSREKGQNLLQNSVMKRNTTTANGLRANFWTNQNLERNGILPYITQGDSADSRSYTDSNSEIRIQHTQSSNALPFYILSSSTPYVVDKDNVLLSFKLNGTIKAGTLFIGYMLYAEAENNPQAGTYPDNAIVKDGMVWHDNHFYNCYYTSVKEYNNSNMPTGLFQTEALNQTIIEPNNIYKEETETLEIYNNGNNQPAVMLSYVPDTQEGREIEVYIPSQYDESAQTLNPSTMIVIDVNDNTVRGREVILPERYYTLGEQQITTVRYKRNKTSYKTIESGKTPATMIANYSPNEAVIIKNTANNLYVYDPLTGTYKLTHLVQPFSMTEINTMRVIIGVRPDNAGAIDMAVKISDLKLEYDTLSPYWTPNGDEVYTKQYRMDEEGFSISTDTNTMFIDEDEIAAYRNDDNGQAITDDPVFQIKESNTILRQTSVRDKISIQYMEERNTRESEAFVMQQLNMGTIEQPDFYFLFY